MARQIGKYEAAWHPDKHKGLIFLEYADGGKARLDAIDAAEYGKLLLVERAGNGAPPLSMFDTDKDQRLQFPEYLALVRHMTERRTVAPTGAVAPATKR